MWIKANEEFFQPFLDETFFKKLNATVQTITTTSMLSVNYLSFFQNAYIPTAGSAATLVEQPAYIKGGQMRDYQLKGVNFFIYLYNNGLSGILGDEMGLVCIFSLFNFSR